MQEIVSLVLIGISLSMDTFSLSLSIGPIIKDSIYSTIIPILVGIFHFFMPLLGDYLGIHLMQIFSIASSVLLGIILIILGIHLLVSYFNNEDITYNVGIVSSLLFALSVSIDSFSVGLGISGITANYILASLLFAICSFIFTYLGLIIGKYSHKYIGSYANILGIILLLIIGLYHLLF